MSQHFNSENYDTSSSSSLLLYGVRGGRQHDDGTNDFISAQQQEHHQQQMQQQLNKPVPTQHPPLPCLTYRNSMPVTYGSNSDDLQQPPYLSYHNSMPMTIQQFTDNNNNNNNKNNNSRDPNTNQQQHQLPLFDCFQNDPDILGILRSFAGHSNNNNSNNNNNEIDKYDTNQYNNNDYYNNNNNNSSVNNNNNNFINSNNSHNSSNGSSSSNLYNANANNIQINSNNNQYSCLKSDNRKNLCSAAAFKPDSILNLEENKKKENDVVVMKVNVQDINHKTIMATKPQPEQPFSKKRKAARNYLLPEGLTKLEIIIPPRQQPQKDNNNNIADSTFEPADVLHGNNNSSQHCTSLSLSSFDFFNNNNNNNNNPVVKKKRRLTRDPAEPKRPLTAYNFFFKHLRAQIVSAGIQSSTSMAFAEPEQDAVVAQAEMDVQQYLLSQKIGQPQAVTKEEEKTSAEDFAIPQEQEQQSNSSTTRTTSRSLRSFGSSSKRQPHGRVGFRELASEVATQWKEASESVKQKYHQLALLEKKRYEREKADYLHHKQLQQQQQQQQK